MENRPCWSSRGAVSTAETRDCHGGFPHHDWADADGLHRPDPVLAETGYFNNDPDSYSQRLRGWHQVLWAKPLPDGTALDLIPHRNGLLDPGRGLFLKSDTAIPAWENWDEAQPLLAPVDKRLKDAGRGSIHDLGWRLYDMGAMILFPGWQVDRQWTINQAKGCLRLTIADRLDLTVECIRLYYEYLHEQQRPGDDDASLPVGYARVNPLGPTLHRYRSFFTLFETFDRYVDFWLLQDLVTKGPSGMKVKFFTPGSSESGHDFTTVAALPNEVDEYVAYLIDADDFVKLRNHRMAREASTLGHQACATCLASP